MTKHPVRLGSFAGLLAGLLAACTEVPPNFYQDLGHDLRGADLRGLPDLSAAADLRPAQDLAPPAVAVTAVSPSLVSSAGGALITVTGTSLTERTQFFINNVLANISSVNAQGTSAVLFAPAHPGIGPATLTARNPDGTTATNSDTIGSATALTVYAAQASFAQSSYSSFFNQPHGIAFGDLNGDGYPDMIVTHLMSGMFTTYLGSFTAPGTFNLLTPAFSFATLGGELVNQTGKLADINNDGKLDLILGTTANQLQYYLGNGAGLVGSLAGEQQGSFTASGDVIQQAVFDFTGDTFADVVTANITSNNLGLFVNSQNSTNLFPGGQSGAISVPTPSRVVNVDLDKDGKQDLVASSESGGNPTLYVFFGQQNGVPVPFVPSTPATYGTNSLNQQPTWVEVGDLNNDGLIDAVVADSATGTLRVFLGSGSRTNTFQGALAPVQVGAAPQQVALGDFNGDGNLDAAVTNTQSSTVSVLLGKGDGTFTSRQDFLSLSQPWGIYALDLNGDKRTDLAVVNAENGLGAANPGLVTIYLNNAQ